MIYELNGKTVFFGNNGVYTDHSIENDGRCKLLKVSDQLQGYKNFKPIVLDNNLYFFQLTNFPHKLEIFKTDGLNVSYIKQIDSLDYSMIYDFTGFRNSEKDLFNQAALLGNQLLITAKVRIDHSNGNNTFRNEIWRLENDVLTKINVLNPLNHPNSSGDIRHFYVSETKAYFFIDYLSQDLYVTDGSTTEYVKTFEGVTVRNSKAVVLKDDNIILAENRNGKFNFWKSNGTSSGTIKINEVNTPNLTQINGFRSFYKGVLFQDNNDSIWYADSSFQQVIKSKFKLSDFNSPNNIQNLDFIELNNKVFGAYNFSSQGLEPASFDFSSNNLQVLSNLNTRTGNALRFENELIYNNKLYFLGNDNSNKIQLFETNGQFGGFKTITDNTDGNLLFQLVKSDANLFYISRLNNISKICKYDLLNASISSIPLNTLSFFNPNKLIPYQGEVLIIAQSSVSQVWKTETLGEPSVVINTNFGFIESLFTYDSLIFASSNGVYISKGTLASTIKYSNIFDLNKPFKIFNYFEFNNQLFIIADFYNGQSIMLGLFRYHKEQIELELVHTFPASYKGMSDNHFFSISNDEHVLFNILDNKSRYELWSMNINAQLKPIGKLNYNYTNSRVFYTEELKNEFYLSYQQDYETIKLLKINVAKSSIDTLLVFDRNDNYRLIKNNNILYAATGLKANQDFLWRTDGTGVGTYYIKAPADKSAPFLINLISSLGEKLIFTGYDASFGTEFYSYKQMPCEGNLNYTVSSGKWSEPTIWSCGRVPFTTENVIIKTGHKIELDSSEIGNAKSIATEPNSVLNFNSGSVFTAKP